MHTMNSDILRRQSCFYNQIPQQTPFSLHYQTTRTHCSIFYYDVLKFHIILVMTSPAFLDYHQLQCCLPCSILLLPLLPFASISKKALLRSEIPASSSELLAIEGTHANISLP